MLEILKWAPTHPAFELLADDHQSEKLVKHAAEA